MIWFFYTRACIALVRGHLGRLQPQHAKLTFWCVPIAALVHAVRPDGVSCSIVNTDTEAQRTLIVQAGAFCEHRFTSAQLGDGRTVEVDSPHLQLRLAPGAAVELELGMELHVSEEPSYARPWGGAAL